jgi:hypothetical protein
MSERKVTGVVTGNPSGNLSIIRTLLILFVQNPNCLLCPRTPNDTLQSKQNALASTILRLSKPTEGRGWVHTLCSVFVPETSFTDATRLRLVEGISSVSDARWASVRQHGMVR